MDGMKTATEPATPQQIANAMMRRPEVGSGPTPEARPGRAPGVALEIESPPIFGPGAALGHAAQIASAASARMPGSPRSSAGPKPDSGAGISSTLKSASRVLAAVTASEGRTADSTVSAYGPHSRPKSRGWSIAHATVTA